MDKKKPIFACADYGYYEADDITNKEEAAHKPAFYSIKWLVREFKSYNNDSLLPQDEHARRVWGIGFRDDGKEKERSDTVENRVKIFIDIIRRAAVEAPEKLSFVLRGLDVLADLSKPYDCDAGYTREEREAIEKEIIKYIKAEKRGKVPKNSPRMIESAVYIDIAGFSYWLVNESGIDKTWIPPEWIKYARQQKRPAEPEAKTDTPAGLSIPPASKEAHHEPEKAIITQEPELLTGGLMMDEAGSFYYLSMQGKKAEIEFTGNNPGMLKELLTTLLTNECLTANDFNMEMRSAGLTRDGKGKYRSKVKARLEDAILKAARKLCPKLPKDTKVFRLKKKRHMTELTLNRLLRENIVYEPYDKDE